jgi:ATP-binding cassette subfamily B protein
MVRNDLFAHINTLSHLELDELGTNSLITIITNDVNQMQLAVAMLIRLVVRAPFLIIGATISAMLLDIKLSAIFLIVAPLVSFILYFVMKKSVPYYLKRQKTIDKIARITRENLSGARVIRAFSKGSKEEERFERANDEAVQIAVRVGKISAILNPATFALLNTAIIAILWFGGMRVDSGSLSQGKIIAFANYITQISLTLVVVANLVIIFTKASASAVRINKVFDMKSSLQEGKLNQDDFPVSSVLLSLKNVSFAYPRTKETAVSNISIDIKKGEWIGIIGGTGSGKTTLVNLIPRFYEATGGEILLGGIPVREYNFDLLRKKVGVVPQKAVLFYGSILENIRYGKEDASEEEIQEAVKTAQAKDFVEEFPEQYEYRIMQGGKNLSGGQRQRLTIARAIVGNPEILILDDSASALDFATEAGLFGALREKYQDMSIIVVSQRINTIKNTDRIMVLEDGKTAGIGTHEELLKTCEIYKEICLSQLSKEEVSL